MKKGFCFLLFAFSLASCAPAAATATPESIAVQSTVAAAPWLADLDACARSNVVRVELCVADYFDLNGVMLVMRIGQPTNLTSPAYQIGTDDLLVIVNRQNPISKLTTNQMRGLFTGQVQTWEAINGTDAPVQVWVFPSGEDVQQIFDQTALGGSPVASAARLANSPDEMSQAVANDVNAIGVLTRHWKAGNVSDVFTVASVPVLAITPSEPQGASARILTCLQKR
jgi:hypothetical protein